MSRFFVEKLEFWRKTRLLLCCFFLAALIGVSSCSSDDDSPFDTSGHGGNNDIPPEDASDFRKTISVEVNALGSATPATLTLSAGETAIINLTPDAGNELLHVEGCKGAITLNGYQVEGTQHDCSVYVVFGPAGEKLTINVFGDGSIESESASLCNARETCERFFPANVPIRLTAIPAPGWFLSHWTGCDSIDNDACIVDMANPAGVYPAFARTEEFTLNSDVTLLGESQIDAIQEVNSTSIVFRSDVEGLDSFEINKILVSTRGNGFARRISRIIAVNQTQVLVQTRLVPISDIIEEGTLVWQGNSTDGSDLEFFPAEGVTVVENENNSLNGSIQVETIVYDEDKNLATQVDQVTLSLGIDTQFTPDFAFEKASSRDVSIRFVVGAQVTVSASVGYKIPVHTVQQIELGKYRLPPVPVGPIVLLPEFELFADFDGSVDTSVNIRTTFSLAGDLGIVKKSGKAWRALDAMLATAESPTLDETEVNADTEIWAGVNSRFLIYGEAGPFLKAGSYSGYKRRIPVQESNSECFQESAYYGARASVGGRTDLIAWESTLPSTMLATRPDEVSWIQDQEARCDTVESGPPEFFHTFLDQKNHVVAQWDPPEGNPLVKYSVFRDNSLIGTVWDLEFLDDDVADNAEHCYHAVGFDSNGRSTVPSYSSCIHTGALIVTAPPDTPSDLSIVEISIATLELFWKASVDDTTIVEYLVQDENRIIEKSSDTRVKITQLLPGTEYCFSVVAVNSAGIRSPQSEVQCARTLTEDADLWRMRIACEGRDYILQNMFYLQSTQEGDVYFTGEGTDYWDNQISYIVNGIFSGDTGLLDGQVTYTFGRGLGERVDLFSVDLAPGDSGDVYMDQISVQEVQSRPEGYCFTVVRFDLIPTLQVNSSDFNLRDEP